MPWFKVKRFLKAIEIAEEMLGHPPSIFQISVVMREKLNANPGNAFEVWAIVISLYREDLVFTD